MVLNELIIIAIVPVLFMICIIMMIHNDSRARILNLEIELERLKQKKG